MLTLAFPNINPIILSFGPLAISWYSLAYVFGILLAWFYANHIVSRFDLGITKKHLEDFVTFAIIGIVIGGRVGYVLLYDPVKYLSYPLDILKTYEGGMSFHGGIAGLIFACYFFCKSRKISFLSFSDIMAITSPIGLFLGRLANFVNAELYGKITDVPWAVIFPRSDMQPRHPSQLYEATFEGVILFIFISLITWKYKTLKFPSLNSALFLISYSLARMFIEIFREPDTHIGYISNYLTMGQILSFPLLLLGIYLLIKLKCQSIQQLEH